MLGLYRFATRLAAPVFSATLSRRLKAGREDPGRIGERRGVAGRPRPLGRLAWVHGASVGEVTSLLPLIVRIRKSHPRLNLLVTSGTVTSAEMLAERLPEGVIHQYLPLDRPDWVARFLNTWRPNLVLWCESDFWPNLLAGARAQNAALLLLNGRMSTRSFRNWRRFPWLIREILGGFSLILAQTEPQGRRLAALGGRNVRCVGNLKRAAPPLKVDEGALSVLEGTLGYRPRWVAASTHAGEEEVIYEAHKILKARHPDLLTIVVPRHPNRGGRVTALAARHDLQACQRSAGGWPGPDDDVYVADTLGELGLFYRLARIAFVGGSLAPKGGQNLLEPARLGCAVIIGPHTENFRDVMTDFRAAEAVTEIRDAHGLAGAVDRLLSDDAARATQAAAALAQAHNQDAVLDRVHGTLKPWLDRAEHARA